MKYIEFRRAGSNTPIWIHPDMVLAVEPSGNSSRLTLPFTGIEAFIVVGSPLDVVAKLEREE